jgi:predicted RNA-binding Zn-ribbon protein involved in translation (DUF1610 family)
VHQHANSLFRLLNLPSPVHPLDRDALRFFGFRDEAAIEMLVAGGILRQAKPATAFDCPECNEYHDVIRQVRGRKSVFYYVGACGFGEVKPDELRQWSIQWKAIADWLASIISDKSKASTIVADKAWQIGSVPFGDAAVSVLLTRRMDLGQLSAFVNPDRSVVLVPESNLLSGDSSAAELCVGDAFTVTDETIAFNPQRIRAQVRLNDASEVNQFIQLGEGWELRFAGKKVWMKDSFGLIYIARLLAKPNAIVSVLTLLATRMGIDEVAINGSTGETIDAKAQADYRDRYETLMRDLPKARENNDHAWLAELETEQQALTSELSSAFGKNGKARVNSDYEKTRKSVYMSITRAIDRIAKRHAELGAYLHGTIKTGGDCRYEEHEPKNWLV